MDFCSLTYRVVYRLLQTLQLSLLFRCWSPQIATLQRPRTYSSKVRTKSVITLRKWRVLTRQRLNRWKDKIYSTISKAIALYETYSPLYCWISPSGNSPDGKSLTTGIVGGSVCWGFFLQTLSKRQTPKLADLKEKDRTKTLLTCFYSSFSSSSSLKSHLKMKHAIYQSTITLMNSVIGSI